MAAVIMNIMKHHLQPLGLTDSLTDLMTKVFVKQPRLHWVCFIYYIFLFIFLNYDIVNILFFITLYTTTVLFVYSLNYTSPAIDYPFTGE